MTVLLCLVVQNRSICTSNFLDVFIHKTFHAQYIKETMNKAVVQMTDANYKDIHIHTRTHAGIHRHADSSRIETVLCSVDEQRCCL